MKSIIDCIKEGLTPAELADMIEDGVYELDSFGRLNNEPLNVFFEKRMRVLDSLEALVLEAKSLQLSLAEFVSRIETGKVSDLEPGIAVLRNGIPAHWLDAVNDLQGVYRKDGVPVSTKSSIDSPHFDNVSEGQQYLKIGWHIELARIMNAMNPVPKQNRPIREAIKEFIGAESVFRTINVTNGDFTWITCNGDIKGGKGATLANKIAYLRKTLPS